MNEILEIDGVFYKHVYDDPKHGCNSCALKKQCDSGTISLASECDFINHYEEFEIEPTEEMIRKVLSLSDDADKAFKEHCRLFTGATIDEQLDNQRRQRTGLLLEERIRFIKDHWKDFYYLQPIRSREGNVITVKI